MAKKLWKLSASFIASFKSCPFRCYLKYVLGIIPVEDTDALRTGTNWHRIREIMGMKPESACPDCKMKQLTSAEILALNTTPIQLNNPVCPICQGTNFTPADLMDAVIRELNRAYATVPMSKTKEEWLTERAILLYSCAGYNWHYADDKFEVVAEEIQFSIPVRNPKNGRALPNVTLDGKIDKIVKSPNRLYYIDEHKSTSKAIDPDSLYWSHLRLDTQTLLYIYATQQLQLAGDLEVYGILSTDPLICGVRYDAWHKPQIKPKKLTQAESKKFVETGEYMGDKLEIRAADVQHTNEINFTVNQEPAEIEPGKKEGTFTIRETPDMYGARLLKDISERPEFYFARKEITRTADDIKRFEQEIYNMYHTIKFMDKNDAWWQNEQQCEATFRCSNLNICYNNIDLSDGKVPEGFKLTKWKERENDCKNR